MRQFYKGLLDKIGIFDRLKVYHSKIDWIVFCSIFLFTIGAWIDINGLWCELPIMVHELPEQWRLPSILSATTQIAQIGPIFFLAGKYFYPNHFTYTRAIYTILVIGAVSCLMLSIFWNKTAVIGGTEVSIGLYILNFSLAILDGTSSVTFLPYIGGNFVKEYIIPNYIGESLAALIPSILSLAQGLGQNPGCHNVTIFNETTNQNHTELKPIPIKPNYPVSVYFILMFLLLSISTSAFTFLNFSKIAKKNRKAGAISNAKNRKINPGTATEDSSDKLSNNEELTEESLNSKDGLQRSLDPIQNLIRQDLIEREKIILLSLVFMLSFICYGVLPGLQSYSTLPYGNDIFNYAVNLSFVFLPIAIFLSIWSYYVSVLRICIEFSIATAFSIYILYLSILSPCPPLMDSWLGPALTILSWILSQSMFMRIRCLIASRLERFGQTILLILGALTMIGQIFGGIIVFVCINIYELLKSKPECATDNSFCNL